jgi:hypothetical protein
MSVFIGVVGYDRANDMMKVRGAELMWCPDIDRLRALLESRYNSEFNGLMLISKGDMVAIEHGEPVYYDEEGGVFSEYMFDEAWRSDMMFHPDIAEMMLFYDGKWTYNRLEWVDVELQEEDMYEELYDDLDWGDE